MPTHKYNFQNNSTFIKVFVFICMLTTGCGQSEQYSSVKETDDHVSPHPHVADEYKAITVDDEEPIRVLNKNELARMEKYLAEYRSRMEIVDTIQLSAGELVDCVTLDTQPALHREELKEHQITLEPPEELNNEKQRKMLKQIDDPAPESSLMSVELEYGSEFPICPEQTIPLRHLTIEILDNFETLEDFFQSRPPHALAGPSDLHQYATSYIITDNWGAQSTLNVWSPYTEKANEFSLSQIAVTRGSGSDNETVEVGWQKYRDLYGDYRPRLFIYFTPDNYGSDGCYNLTCGAFVQINNSVYIGGGFTNISAHPHPSRVWEFTIRWQRHDKTGDWWLNYGNTWVGYYPSNLFDNNGLKSHGDMAHFYGEIIDKQTWGLHTSTDMGSGHFPSDGFGYAAYQRRIRTITTTNSWNMRPSLGTFRSDKNCYDIDLHNSLGNWETYFYFGGPGYNSHCQ